MMNFVDSFFDRWMKPVEKLPVGIYQYQSPPETEPHYRLHLRVEADGRGILILNAHTVMHLNQTAAEYAYYWMLQIPEADVVRNIGKRYRMNRDQIRKDFLGFKEQIETMVVTTDIDPVTYLGFDREEPYPADLSSPYRLDCAITYETTAGDQKSAPNQRVSKELTFDEWKAVLEKTWAAGVPHVIFTGGEPTLRPDLPDLIAVTQQIGQVSGLLTDGARLTEAGYLNDLLQRGLDHIMIVLDAGQENIWQAVKLTLAEDIHLTVHLTIDRADLQHWEKTITRLAEMGVYALSLSAASPSYKETLTRAHHLAAEKGMHLVWDLPVPYSHINPVSLEDEEEIQKVDGAGKAWLYIEPDGDVLPRQGEADNVLGNILNDPWESVWEKAKSLFSA